MRHFLLILVSLFFSISYSQTILVYDQELNMVSTYFKDTDNDIKPLGYSSLVPDSEIINIYDLNHKLIFYYTNRSIYFYDGTKLAYIEFDNINETHIFYDNNAKKQIGYMEIFTTEDNNQGYVISKVYNRNNKLIYEVFADSSIYEFKVYSHTFIVMSYLPLLFENSNF